MTLDIELKGTENIQHTLMEYYHAPSPNPRYVSSLEERLLQNHASRQESGGVKHEARGSFLRGLTALQPKISWRLVLLGLILLLTIGVAAIGPDRVLAKVQRWLGYVPGIGFVEDNQGLRTIREPISESREGVTVVVKQAVADSQRTIILYKVEGLSLVGVNTQGEDAQTGSRPTLRLPDGTGFEIIEGEARGWGAGYTERLVYPALPPDVDSATLEILRLMDMPAGAAPENWHIVLPFMPAPSDLTVMPVIEISTRTPVDTTQPASDDAEAGPHGIGLQVERSVALEDGYLVTGSLSWDDRYPAEYGVSNVGDMQLTDVNGQEIPIEASDPDETGTASYRTSWAYRTQGTSYNGPLTFTLRSVEVRLVQPVSFGFDPGANPKDGQEWVLSKEIEVLGYPVEILSARFEERRGMRGFVLEIQADPSLTSFQMNLTGPNGEPLGNSGAGGSHPNDSGCIIAEVLTDGPVHGPITLNIRVAGLHGPWRASWTPAAVDQVTISPTPIPQACLTLEQWKEVADQGSVELPRGLSGRVVAYGPLDNPDEYVIYTANLDGSEKRVIGEGTWPALSPDGSKTAYSVSGGLNIVDNASGEVNHLPGTVDYDYHPLWSPDGTRIAFVRVSDLNIHLINPDGTGLRSVTSGVEYELLAGWSPDSTKLYYVMLSEAGLTLKVFELATGVVNDLFAVGPKDVPSISPDGQRVAFADRVFGKKGYGLYISSLDGADQRLLVQLDDWSVAGHLWSPDGKWLIVSVNDPGQLFGAPMPALVGLDTCQIVPLNGLTGYVHAWLP